MGTKENKELVRKFWEVAEKGDYDAFGDYITEDSVDHTPMPGQPAGLEGAKYVFRTIRGAFPDFSQEITDMVVEGDRIDIIRVNDGKMTDHWGLQDQITFMTQLGVMPGAN